MPNNATNSGAPVSQEIYQLLCDCDQAGLQLIWREDQLTVRPTDKVNDLLAARIRLSGPCLLKFKRTTRIGKAQVPYIPTLAHWVLFAARLKGTSMEVMHDVYRDIETYHDLLSMSAKAIVSLTQEISVVTKLEEYGRKLEGVEAAGSHRCRNCLHMVPNLIRPGRNYAQCMVWPSIPLVKADCKTSCNRFVAKAVTPDVIG